MAEKIKLKDNKDILKDCALNFDALATEAHRMNQIIEEFSNVSGDIEEIKMDLKASKKHPGMIKMEMIGAVINACVGGVFFLCASAYLGITKLWPFIKGFIA